MTFRMLLKPKSLPKLSAAEPNSPMDMTWERLILLSLSTKQPKTLYPDARLLVIEPVHHRFCSILFVTFLLLWSILNCVSSECC